MVFSAEDPYEIAKLYRNNGIGRDQLVNELSEWVPTGIQSPKGTFESVKLAYDWGLIDLNIIYEVDKKTKEKCNGTTSPINFSADDPYEIAKQYNANVISRAQLVKELSEWMPYDNRSPTGRFEGILLAYREGYINKAIIKEVDEAIKLNATVSSQSSGTVDGTNIFSMLLCVGLIAFWLWILFK
jgi:hypothetical protein